VVYAGYFVRTIQCVSSRTKMAHTAMNMITISAKVVAYVRINARQTA
jgi:hypothetical protein